MWVLKIHTRIFKSWCKYVEQNFKSWKNSYCSNVSVMNNNIYFSNVSVMNNNMYFSNESVMNNDIMYINWQIL